MLVQLDLVVDPLVLGPQVGDLRAENVQLVGHLHAERVHIALVVTAPGQRRDVELSTAVPGPA